MVLAEAGREPIVVVGRIERRPLRITAGYRTLLSADARWLTVVAGGVLGAHTKEDHDAVVKALLDSLRDTGADMLQLAKVVVDGPLHRAATDYLPWYRRGHGTEAQPHHQADLTGGFEAFLARRSRNTRQRLRRRLRALHERAGRMAVSRVGPGHDAAETCRMIDRVAAASYQRGIGAGFVDDDLHRALVSWAVGGDEFRIWLLSIDAAPVAFLSGLRHGRTFFLFDTAFHPAHADDEPGALLLARVVEELAGEPDIDTFDLAFGDAQYKQSLSDVSWAETDIAGFATRPRPLGLNALGTGTALAVSLAKRVLGGERVAAIRRRRRDELATTDPAPAADPAAKDKHSAATVNDKDKDNDKALAVRVTEPTR
jgi:CelD/BcsL family acetyltransferase involved in cellulose biosynthesis